MNVKIIIVVIIVIVTLIVIFGREVFVSTPEIGTASENQETQKQLAAPELRLTLNYLLRENVGATLKVARDTYDQEPTREASMLIAEENQKQIVGLFDGLFAEDVEQAVDDFFTVRLANFVRYADSLREFNTRQAEAARVDLIDNSQDLTSIILKLDETIDVTEINQLLEQDARLMKDAINTYIRDEFTISYNVETQARENLSQISKQISDTLSDKYPERFPGNVDDPSVERESKLNALLRERTNKQIDLMRSISASKDSQIALETQLKQVDNQLAALFAEMYGEAEGDVYVNLAQNQMDLLSRFANQFKSADEILPGSIQEDLEKNIDLITNYFYATNQLLPAGEVGNLLMSNLDHITSSYRAYIQTDYYQSLEREHEAYREIGQLGKMLVRNYLVEYAQ